MAIAAVLIGARGTSTGSSVTTTAGTSTGGSGNHGVLCLSWQTSSSISGTITDSKGNTFTAVGSAQSDGNGGSLQFFIAQNWTGGASHSITVNFSAAAFPVAHLIEVTGAATSPQDINGSAAPSGSPYTVTTGTLAQAAECVLSACAANGGSSGAYSTSTDTLLSQEPDVSQFFTSGVGYKVTASTSAITPSWTVSGRTGGAAVIYLALKEAGAGTHATSGALASDAATVAGTATRTALPGTGPQPEPFFGNGPMGAGPFGTYLRGIVSAGGHATTGALSAQDATIAGTATHTAVVDGPFIADHSIPLAWYADPGVVALYHQTLGIPLANRSDVVSHATSGALVADTATVSGAAAHEHATTGALNAQTAAVAGAAAHFALHSTSGALSAQSSTVSGTAAHQHVATGALSAQTATISGAADHTVAGSSHSTSGALSAQDASLSGTATHLTLHATTGALVAQSATVSGTAAHPHVAAGALAAQDATLSGTSTHLTLHTSAGALVSQEATISGVAAHTFLVTHVTSGALQAGDASISGAATGPGSTGGGYSDDKPTKRQRWLVQVGKKVFEVASVQEAQALMDKVDTEEAQKATQAVQKQQPVKKTRVRIVSAPTPVVRAKRETTDTALVTRQLLRRIEEYNATIDAIVRLAQEQDDEEALLMLL